MVFLSQVIYCVDTKKYPLDQFVNWSQENKELSQKQLPTIYIYILYEESTTKDSLNKTRG